MPFSTRASVRDMFIEKVRDFDRVYGIAATEESLEAIDSLVEYAVRA
jgi:hypothetical protein